MKKIKRLVAVLLSVVTLFGFASCKNTNGGSGTIQISYWNSGWGDEWLYEIADAFEEKNPGYTIEIDSSVADGRIADLLPIPDENPYDIIMGSNTKSALRAEYYEPLNDVVNAKNDGENKTVGEKMGEHILSMLIDNEDEYKSLFFGSGFYTIVYNADIYAKYEIEEPKTTDELKAVIELFKGYGVAPFIHFTGGGYLHAMFWTWIMQYSGYQEFYKLVEEPSLAKMTDDDNGIKQALQVIYEIIGADDNYYTGSTGMDFTTCQATFLAPSSRVGKEIAMMINGAWMENEMKKTEDEVNKNYKAMKTPVVSSIIEKCSTINDDEMLAKVISAIDKGKTSYSGVSAEDFARVKNARTLEVSNVAALECMVPNYSDCIDGAKEFLKFFYSDESLKIFAEKTHILSVVDFADSSIKIDNSNFSVFEKSQNELISKSKPVIETCNKKVHEVFTDGGLSLLGGYKSGVYVTSLEGIKGTSSKIKDAEDLWEKVKASVTDSWPTCWANIGLTPPQN